MGRKTSGVVSQATRSLLVSLYYISILYKSIHIVLKLANQVYAGPDVSDFFILICLETKSLYVALAVLELTRPG